MKINRELDALLRFGQFNRRTFLARCAAMGISAGFAASYLGTAAKAATPKRGGLFRLGLSGGSTTDVLDPALVTTEMMMVLSYALRNCLVEIDHEGNLIPELAESWEASPDARTWAFKLRKGVEFHNAKSLTAQDVVYSIEWHRRADSESAAKASLEIIESMKIDGDAVIFNLKSGSADFPFVLADYRMQIFPEETTDFSKSSGTGGYEIESFEPGVRANLKRAPNYWKDGRAHFDEVEVLTLSDTTARSTALLTGAVDKIDKLVPHLVTRLQEQSGIEVTSLTGAQHVAFSMRTDTPPFDNKDVRLALKYAVDRDDLLNRVLAGHGTVGNDNPIGPTYPYYADDLPKRAYDPDQAKFHLKKAGAEGLKVQLSASDVVFDRAVDAATVYREYAAAAGIDIEVVREPSDGYWSNVWMQKPFFSSLWYGRPTEDWAFTLTYASGGSWNETYWHNERFDKLLVEARAELNPDRRRELYRELQLICRDDGGAIIPMFVDYLEAHSDRLASGPIAANYPLDGLRIIERWWLA